MPDTPTHIEEMHALYRLVAGFADILNVERDRMLPLASGELKVMADEALIALDALTFAVDRWLEQAALLQQAVTAEENPHG